MKTAQLIVGLGDEATTTTIPLLTTDAAGIREVETLYGKSSLMAAIVTDFIHEEAARDFERLLGLILEDWFPC